MQRIASSKIMSAGNKHASNFNHAMWAVEGGSHFRLQQQTRKYHARAHLTVTRNRGYLNAGHIRSIQAKRRSCNPHKRGMMQWCSGARKLSNGRGDTLEVIEHANERIIAQREKAGDCVAERQQNIDQKNHRNTNDGKTTPQSGCKPHLDSG